MGVLEALKVQVLMDQGVVSSCLQEPFYRDLDQMTLGIKLLRTLKKMEPKSRIKNTTGKTACHHAC